MTYWTLLKLNPRTIGFGFLNTFFSGLGQTHFIAIFSPIIMSAFALSSTEYGALYSLITLASGFFIYFIGPMIDRYDARWFGLAVGIGLLVSQILIFSMNTLTLVAMGLFGLRLFGQGLSSSLASITLARFFEKQRGKALSLSQMGFPVFEGLVTPVAAFLLGVMPFQNLILILAASVILIYLPLTFMMTRKIPTFNKMVLHTENLAETKFKPKSWNRRQVFSHQTIYLIIPQALMPPFALTGVFFHQAVIADLKGWTLSLMASGLFFFAIGRVINTFVTGPLVDRYQAMRLFPLYQTPLSLAFLVLALGDKVWVPGLCFTLFGVSVGAGGPIKSAIWAELYGVRHLGAIKSLFAALMIFSTAASPALFGWIIDQSQSPTTLLFGLFLTSILASILSFIGLKLHP